MMSGVPYHKATATSADTHKYEYANLFIYFNAQFYMISNHLAIFLAVIVAWWPASLQLQGMGFGPQGQGDVRHRL
jgi:hypothetical protein